VSSRVDFGHSGEDVQRPKIADLGRWRMPRNHPEVEQYRSLCARLRQLTAENEKGKGRVVGITSAMPGEGKTTTAVNLSVTLARDFHCRVLLLEADLRQPSIHAAICPTGGLVDHITRRTPLEEVLIHTSLPQLSVLTAGALDGGSSTEHLGTSSIDPVLATLREFFDYVIVDCPPLLPAADMGLISEWLDQILLVIRAGITSRDTVRRAVIGTDRAKFSGAVLNGMIGTGKVFGYDY